MTPDPEERIELGHLTGAWGSAGWVKIFSRTDPPENIFEYQPWLTDGEPGRFHVREWHRRGRRLVAHIVEIADRDQADACRGLKLWVSRSALPEPDGQSWYWDDLIGLDAFALDGSSLGSVVGLLDTGAHDILRIRPTDDAQQDSTVPPPEEILVPFVAGRYVHSVDVAGGRIELDWDPDW